MFAATLPLEAKKALFSLVASLPGFCLDLIDAARAYFQAKARRRVHVDWPKEDQRDGMRGRLQKAMHGTRDAAQNWELEYSEMVIVEAGFTQGSYSVCFQGCSCCRTRR